MNKKSILLSSIFFVSAASFLPLSAHAQTVTPEQLQAELGNLQRQIDTLKQQQSALNTQAAVLQSQARQQHAIAIQQAAVAVQQAEIVKDQKKNTWTMSGHDAIPSFRSKQDGSTFGIGGQVALDSALGTVPHQHGFSGGTQFKHLELNVKGVYAKHYLFKLEEDFSKTSSPLGGVVDAYLGYTTKIGKTGNVFLVGNQLTPFGFQMASDETLFLETDMGTNLFQDGRQIGITGHTYTQHWNAWYGVSAAPASKAVSHLTYNGNSQSTAALDLAWNIVNTPGHLLSVRNSIEFNKFNGNQSSSNQPTFEATPDLTVYGNDFISTGALNVQSDYVESPRIDVEYGRFTAAATYFSAHMQSNAYVSATNRRKMTPSFSSWDLETQYFLTDDYEPYSTAQGYYGAVEPSHPVTKGGLGAIQLTGRIDNANLNNYRYDVHGGNETNITLGVNWWPTKNTRVNLNYVKVLPVEGSNSTTNKGASASIVALRLIFIL